MRVAPFEARLCAMPTPIPGTLLERLGEYCEGNCLVKLLLLLQACLPEFDILLPRQGLCLLFLFVEIPSCTEGNKDELTVDFKLQNKKNGNLPFEP